MTILAQKNETYTSGEFSLVALRKEDIYLIKEWRNAQMDVLRQAEPLTDADQDRYYSSVIKPSQDQKYPELVLFSILHECKAVGYGGLTNLSWQHHRAEVSFLLDPECAKDPDYYESAFSAFLTLLKAYAFEMLKINRLFTETYDMRPHHISVLESNGFQFEARLEQHVYVEGEPVDSLIHALTRSDYESTK